MQHILACLAAVLCGLSAPPASAQVDGKIVRVGLFAGAQLVRNGNWSFVEVELRWRGEKPFAGKLHVDQFDRDGDVVTSVTDAVLPPDGEWHRRQLYFVPYDIDNNNIVHVRLYDEQGRLVKMLDERGQEVSDLASQVVLSLSEEKFLIVDLTTPRRLPHAAWLDSESIDQSDALNARKVRTLPPQDLPARAQGLEAVDAIVWDNADPGGLSEQQIDALVKWVEAGGRLLITAGTSWQALKNSPLADALPVAIEGASQTREAQEFTEIVRNDDYAIALDKQYNKHPITRCVMRPLTSGLAIPAVCASQQIAYRRLLGRGSLVFVGASLKELLPAPARLSRPDEAGESAIGLGPIKDDPFLTICKTVIAETFLALARELPEPTGGTWGNTSARDLFQDVRRSVGFEELSGAFVFFAILFALAYTLVAAGGSYWYLNRRSMRHLCWVAFAAVGIVGSVVGTAMVWLLRGVTTQVWQTTIVDAPSGLNAAQATCLFGVKTPDHTRLVLRLPQGTDDAAAERQFGLLRPMPETVSQEAFESRFVAPENYRSVREGIRLEDVPVRATLKEFQGHWQGPLGGTLDARLIARRPEDSSVSYQEFTDPSVIQNHLGVDLRDCYLLETREETAARATTLAALVNCFYLGDLPKTGPGSTLNGEQIRQRLYYAAKSGANPGDPPSRITKLPPLSEQAKLWKDQVFGSVLGAGDARLRVGQLGRDQEYYAILLLSVLNLLENGPQDHDILRRSHGRPLDCTQALTNRTAILIGWSDNPPPAQLEIDDELVRPSRSRTVYRFVIPVERPK